MSKVTGSISICCALASLVLMYFYSGPHSMEFGANYAKFLLAAWAIGVASGALVIFLSNEESGRRLGIAGVLLNGIFGGAFLFAYSFTSH